MAIGHTPSDYLTHFQHPFCLTHYTTKIYLVASFIAQGTMRSPSRAPAPPVPKAAHGSVSRVPRRRWGHAPRPTKNDLGRGIGPNSKKAGDVNKKFFLDEQTWFIVCDGTQFEQFEDTTSGAVILPKNWLLDPLLLKQQLSNRKNSLVAIFVKAPSGDHPWTVRAKPWQNRQFSHQNVSNIAGWHKI